MDRGLEGDGEVARGGVAAGEVWEEGRMLADNGLAPSLRRQLAEVSQA
jgi:hypothetical protein